MKLLSISKEEEEDGPDPDGPMQFDMKKADQIHINFFINF
jgi:hypothetical protein